MMLSEILSKKWLIPDRDEAEPHPSIMFFPTIRNPRHSHRATVLHGGIAQWHNGKYRHRATVQQLPKGVARRTVAQAQAAHGLTLVQSMSCHPSSGV